ncbi:MAG TPA: FGGY family carbohydrate kinase [Longimicrobiaceae bacterium]|nr:FGGY family carbohydrate kinase [Longimicrobiaceae bacterium]
MKGEPTLLAIDIGSSSVRCRLYGADLRGAGGGGAAVERYGWRTSGGAMEVDADELLAGVARVVDAGLAAARGSGAGIVAVAPTTFWHSVVGLDVAGDPITPLYGWGDSRAAAAAAELASRLEPSAYHQRTGCFLHASYPAAKLRWLRRAEPARFAAAALWGSFGEYLEWRLFGSPRCSLSIASGSGLLDARTLEWDLETLEAIGVGADRLSALVNLEPRRGLTPGWAVRWPALADIPWFPALGDGACANVGVGAVGHGRMGVTVGTSAAARAVTEAAPAEVIPDDLWSYRLDARFRVAGGALSNGGNGLAYLLERFPQLTLPEIDRALRERTPDAHGLTVIPSLLAERGLGWADGAAATVAGLRPDTGPLDLAVAWIEALSQRVAALVTRLESHFGEVAELRATGGALHVLPGWLRTIADAAGRPVRLASHREATSRGAAIVAAREIGWLSSIAGPVEDADSGELAMPATTHTRIHGDALARQRALAAAIGKTLNDPASSGARPPTT